MNPKHVDRRVLLASIGNWIDGWDAVEFADIFLNLMNGSYTVEQLRQDFEEWTEEIKEYNG